VKLIFWKELTAKFAKNLQSKRKVNPINSYLVEDAAHLLVTELAEVIFGCSFRQAKGTENIR
jgi:hypothetical protein